MRVLVTGGAGYIGNELVYALSGEQSVEQIIVYDNLVKSNYNLFTGLRKLPNRNVKFVQGDILDSRLLRKAMDGVDVVYHLAGKVAAPYVDQNPHDYEQNNHWGTAELVYAAEDVRPGRVVYLSSAAVYGEGLVSSVDHLCRPDSYYGISKYRAERHLSRLADQLPVCIMRCANVYGYSKNLRVETLINSLAFSAHFFNRIEVHGDVSARKAIVNIKYAVSVLKAAMCKSFSPGVYNLGQRNLSVSEVVDVIREMYPALEVLYVDQHLPVKNLELLPDDRFVHEGLTLLDDLLDFKEKFTF